jgi:uncharacterized protein (TIGR02757 family)
VALKRRLEALYCAYNRREYVHPDPLELLYSYEKPRDQEIVGLLAASLAYGRVTQILASIRKVLGGIGTAGGESARAFLKHAEPNEIFGLFDSFRHRFTTGREISSLLVGIKRAIESKGSLEQLFVAGLGGSDDSILPALAAFVERLRILAGGAQACASLLSSPVDGSACKRLNLFLRWMVRRDAVDPGPWTAVSPALLIVPLDTHLFRIARRMGLTARRQPDLKTAVEVTQAFARLCPEDPVRYDFALTRLGINPLARRAEGGRGLPRYPAALDGW